MTDHKKNEQLTFLIFSLPDDEEQANDTTQSVVHYTVLKRELSAAESLLFTACTEKTLFYEDEYNTRGGGTKSVFADYLLGRYSSDGAADWRRLVAKPALSGVDSFWNDEIAARFKKLPKHDVMIAAPTIKEAYDAGESYLERLDEQMLMWNQQIVDRKEKLSNFEMEVLALDINDFRDEDEQSSESAYNEDRSISPPLEEHEKK